MPSTKLTLTLIAASALGLTACTDPDGTVNNTGAGAVLGAGIGALAGQAIGNDTRSTVIGTVVGGTIGAVVGNALDEQEKQLRRDLGGSGARIVNNGSQLLVVLPEGILFPIDSAVVNQNSRQNIVAISRSLQDYPNTTVQVIGHTDNTGTRQYNQQLSNRRANAVRNILVQAGTSGGRIQACGVGEDQPIDTNANARGRQANRRVEIVITPNG